MAANSRGFTTAWDLGKGINYLGLVDNFQWSLRFHPPLIQGSPISAENVRKSGDN